MNTPLTYISLFSSAGVGCYGFKQSGFECVATNEMLEKRMNVQRCNNKCKYESGYITGDITQDKTKSLLYKEIDRWVKKSKIKDIDVIVATPPCQGMSVANHKKGDEKNRNSLVVESIKLTKDIKPKFFVFENVRAFLKTICGDIDGKEKPIEEAIEINLGGLYNIESRVLNFKDYGSNSSRTRTLVIGVRKDILDVTPTDCFPLRSEPKTLKELLNDLPDLHEMGSISEEDIFHGFRSYDQRMLPWIENLKEGESAFDNKEESRIPHRVVNGEVIFNKQKNGDKYARWYWDREGPCIHTRNDILASQNTIHPKENRVFSIRELMRMMTIPNTFKWSNFSNNYLNTLVLEEKRKFLKKEELNIRQCIGEAVPTEIFRKISENIKENLAARKLSIVELRKIIQNNGLFEIERLKDFINNNIQGYSIKELFEIAELSNLLRQKNAAYYTRQDICFTVTKDLPDFKGRNNIRILEPSVGVGNFLPLIFQKYSDVPKVYLDLVDIDNNSLDILKILLGKIGIPENFMIRYINDDFLLKEFEHQYDLVVGNPPYNKITKAKELLAAYKSGIVNAKTNNIFSYFIEKSIKIGKFVSLIVPKSLINAPEFDMTRTLLSENNLLKICDYGEKAFRGVKIETISFLLETKAKSNSEKLKVESYISQDIVFQDKEYVFDKKFPYWLIYRNSFFDEVSELLILDVFNSFRDRQITKKDFKEDGNIRVLKSRNIQSNKVIEIDGYDKYVDCYERFSVGRFYNLENVIAVPNLTYYPRATFLPENCIADGSVALLTLRNGHRTPTEEDLAFYSSKKFESYYRVARNYGTRSLNIDSNSVFFFGLLKEKQ